jgi:hypothetical protein
VIQYELFDLFDQIWDDNECDIIVPEVDERNTKSEGLEPLLGRVRVKPYLKELVDSGAIDQRVVGPYSKLDVCVIKKSVWMKVGITDGCFKNCNTPEDVTL